MSYIDVLKDSSISFDKVSKYIPDHEWERLDHPVYIKRYLNKRNTVHLHQAQGDPCTIHSMIKLLEKVSFTKFVDELLKGTANLEGIGISTIQKSYFKEKNNNQDHCNHRYHPSSQSKI